MAVKKIKSPVESYMTEGEAKPLKEKKAAISLFVSPSVYEDIKTLAEGFGTSAGNLINEILSEYVDTHRDELNKCKKLLAELRAIRKQ